MKKSTLALATTLALSFGITGQAYAGALATSVVKFENFQAFWDSTDTQVDFADFESLSFTGSADVSADLDSVAGTASDAGLSTNGSVLDLYVFQGDVGVTGANYTDNDFTEISSAGGFPTSNFAIGDSFESGAPITGLPDPSGVGTIDSNADLANASYVSLEAGDIGSATSNNGLTASIEFIAGTDDAIRFEFDVDTFAEAFLDVGEVAPSFAQASWSISLILEDITGGTFALDFAISCDVSRTAPGGSTGTPTNGIGSGECGATGPFSVTTANLIAGNTYELTARILTAADAQLFRVPEPSITALMGIGLLGFGLLGYSRRRSLFKEAA